MEQLVTNRSTCNTDARAHVHVPRGLFHVFEYSVEGTLLLGFNVLVNNGFHKTNARCIDC